MEKGETQIHILCLNRKMANQMYLLQDQTLLFAEGAVMEDDNGLRLETDKVRNTVMSYPKGAFTEHGNLEKDQNQDEIFDCWILSTEEKRLDFEVTETGNLRYTVKMPDDFMEGLKDVLVQIRYTGDIGYAFIDGEMIHDNFCNSDVWEIGLADFAQRLAEEPLTIVITPLREGANVNVESAMAARMENVEAFIGELKSIALKPVYEIAF